MTHYLFLLAVFACWYSFMRDLQRAYFFLRFIMKSAIYNTQDITINAIESLNALSLYGANKSITGFKS